MMCKDLFFKFISMPCLRDAINCLLRYTLGQPVDMDVMVVLFLVAEYIGISHLFSTPSVQSEEAGENTAEDLLQADLVS
jgi:hypothetical protein